MDRTIISICGGSGCGKSLLAKQLVEYLGADRAVRVPTDYYLKSNPYPGMAEFFRHPLQYDWDLLDLTLRMTDGMLVTTPDYDFVNFRRRSDQGGREYCLRPVILIDAMLPYPGADLTVLLECSDEERRRRIIERDQRWKTQVIDDWALHQVTLKAMLREKPSFDLILDGQAPVIENVQKLYNRLVLNQRITE